MKLDRKQLKRQARESMRAARPAPFWVALLLAVIMMALGLLTMSLDGTLAAMRTMYAAALRGQAVFVEPVPVSGFFGSLLGLALEIMTMEMGVGFVVYALRVWRKERAGCGELFDGFGVFFRSIWITMLPVLLQMAWSLLYAVPVSVLFVMTDDPTWLIWCLPLLAPTIMAAYSYRLSTCIMLDNPGSSCWRCVQLSRQIMQGHRWQSFVLDMSFLGWMLLCLVPVAGLILAVWVMVYMQVVNAGLYCTLAEDLLRRVTPEQPAP